MNQNILCMLWPLARHIELILNDCTLVGSCWKIIIYKVEVGMIF